MSEESFKKDALIEGELVQEMLQDDNFHPIQSYPTCVVSSLTGAERSLFHKEEFPLWKRLRTRLKIEAINLSLEAINESFPITNRF